MSGRRFAPGARVAVLTRAPLDRPLDYIAPEGGVAEGDFVEVPLGPRAVAGVVWGSGEDGIDLARLKPVTRRLDRLPMTGELRGFLTRFADYTLTPLPAALRLATRVPLLDPPPAPRRVLRAGPGRPARMTPARASVLDVLAGDPGARWAPAALAEAA
ncbi:MAG: primosomal protein N', partial [Pseudomonadota bacterium]